MVVNKIISDAFRDSPDVPKELSEIINRFLEMEDRDTYKDAGIITLFERRLQEKYIPTKNDSSKEKNDFINWCKEFTQ